MAKYKTVADCFDDKGNFIIPGFDPYRSSGDPEKLELRNYLFDEDGYALHDGDIVDLLHKNKHWNWTCDAIKYYYAGECIDANCKGNYTAVYAWRH